MSATKVTPRICSVDGCEKTAKRGSWMCSMHLARIARHGDPHIVIPHAERNFPRGPESHAWNAEGSYSAVHQRLRYQRGPARNQICVDCQGPARQWSLNGRRHDDPFSEGEGPYSTDLSRYVPRCVPCHKRHDLAELARLAEVAR